MGNHSNNTSSNSIDSLGYKHTQTQLACPRFSHISKSLAAPSAKRKLVKIKNHIYESLN